jgi:large subunit ribosomal protein L25
MATGTIPTLDAQLRSGQGSHDARRIRHAGRLPAVIYGHQQDNRHVTLDAKALTDLLHHNVHLVQVQADGLDETCLIKDVQWNHLSDAVIHLDLNRVDLNERVTVSVGIELSGEPVGIKEAGAILEHPLSELEIECVVSDIPESIKADITHLDVGDTLTVKDLVLPADVTTEEDPDTVVAAIRVMMAEEEEEPAAEGAEGEPEVIGKKEGEEADENQADQATESKGKGKD